MKVKLEVVKIETGEVVQTLEAPATQVDRTVGGMLINMDTDRYFVREVRGSDAEPSIETFAINRS